MNEYIKLEAAVTIADYAVDEHPYDKNTEKPETFSEYNQGWHDACDYVRDKLEQLSADVVPVRHGRWINEVELRPWLYGWVPLNSVVCSVCDHSNSFENIYCPNCGAKMDGGDDK